MNMWVIKNSIELTNLIVLMSISVVLMNAIVDGIVAVLTKIVLTEKGGKTK